jgi:hypothetical protein
MNGMTNVILKMHAMTHRAKSDALLTNAQLQNFLNRLVVDSPHFGRADQSQDESSSNGARRGSGKRPLRNGENNNGNGGKKPRPDELEDGPMKKKKGKGRGKGKGKNKMRNIRHFDFNAIAKALKPKEQQRHRDVQSCFKCQKLAHRMSKCPMLQYKLENKANKQD